MSQALLWRQGCVIGWHHAAQACRGHSWARLNWACILHCLKPVPVRKDNTRFWAALQLH